MTFHDSFHVPDVIESTVVQQLLSHLGVRGHATHRTRGLALKLYRNVTEINRGRVNGGME